MLSWDYPVLNQTPESITTHPKEGAYVRGIFLEGARWDVDAAVLGMVLPDLLQMADGEAEIELIHQTFRAA